MACRRFSPWQGHQVPFIQLNPILLPKGGDEMDEFAALASLLPDNDFGNVVTLSLPQDDVDRSGFAAGPR